MPRIAESLVAVLNIRIATQQDRDATWEIFHEVVAPGDTYAFDPNISRDDALAYWFASGTRTYVAEQDRRVVGTYILKPNQGGGGAHVANAAFMVALSARGKGIGRAMGEHCLVEASVSVSARYNSTSWSQQTNPPFVYGKSSALKLSALCRRRFDTQRREMSMFTSCFARSEHRHPASR